VANANRLTTEIDSTGTRFEFTHESACGQVVGLTASAASFLWSPTSTAGTHMGLFSIKRGNSRLTRPLTWV